MKAFLSFVTGILIGAIGYAVILIIAPGTDKFIKYTKDQYGFE